MQVIAFMSPRMIECTRKVMIKYAGQLVRIATGEA